MDALHLAELCRWFVAVVLLAAAVAKIADLTGFAASLSNGFSVPDVLSRPLAVGIVGAESVAAAGLAAGGESARWAAVVALLLLVVFSLAIGTVLLMKRRVSCRCFGASTQTLSTVDLGRNAIYIAAAAGYLWLEAGRAPGGLAAHLMLALGAGLCFLVSISMQDIRNLLR
ncbi:MAG: hypothetical protein M3Q42_10095 [Pseudomonadota bacterium]|nr:hypothetical protein [Pseudomonadota bacterium]